MQKQRCFDLPVIRLSHSHVTADSQSVCLGAQTTITLFKDIAQPKRIFLSLYPAFYNVHILLPTNTLLFNI